MRNRFYSLVFCAFVCCTFVACTGGTEIAALQQKEKIQSDSLELLHKTIDSLKTFIKNAEQTQDYWFDEEDINELKAKGLSAPEEEITNDLKKHPELIPYKGVLGGTMRIEDYKLLGDRWVAAYFDDGHVEGEMLLTYSISKDSTINWKVLDKYMK